MRYAAHCWRPSFRRLRWLAVAGCLLFGLAAPGALAQQACDPLPDVPWWRGVDHAAIKKFVNEHYDGNWARHIGAWEKQLARLSDIQRQGMVAVITPEQTAGQDPSREPVRVSGGALAAYIGQVKKRLAIVRCLARQEGGGRIPGKAGKAGARPPRKPTAAETAGGELAKLLDCARCHGQEGQSIAPMVPNLAGQKESYLIKQLLLFHQGISPAEPGAKPSDRHGILMTGRSRKINEAVLRNLAAYYAGLSPCPDAEARRAPSLQPATVKQCEGCHGVDGRSLFPEVPNLAGQRDAYLLGQLREFHASAVGDTRDRLLWWRYHSVMSDLVPKLSETEIGQAADYYAALACQR